MGNCFSSSQRRCGICYFELDEECAALVEPSVHRSYTWRKDSHIHDEERTESPDEQLPFPLPEAWREFLRIEIKAKLGIFQASRKRGCRGCESIIKAVESACADDGVFLDSKSWEEVVQITWVVPSGRDRELSNLKIVLTANVSKRDAPDRGSEEYHLWTILIDVDRAAGHEKEENCQFSRRVEFVESRDSNVSQGIPSLTSLRFRSTIPGRRLPSRESASGFTSATQCTSPACLVPPPSCPNGCLR
jgi:hypothetical protein